MPKGHTRSRAWPSVDDQLPAVEVRPVTHQGFRAQGLPAPGAEIVPSNDPLVRPVTGSNIRWTVKLPVAPTNLPVPPVIVACSTIVVTVPRCACPVKSAVNTSPLAAVKV